MTAQSGKGSWIPLIQYATQKGVSLSTLRRHIKANKIVYKLVKGKYYLYDESAPEMVSGFEFTQENQDSLTSLAKELKNAQEEIAELKTLIALYEESSPQISLDNQAY